MLLSWEAESKSGDFGIQHVHFLERQFDRAVIERNFSRLYDIRVRPKYGKVIVQGKTPIDPKITVVSRVSARTRPGIQSRDGNGWLSADLRLQDLSIGLIPSLRKADIEVPAFVKRRCV